MSDDLLEWAADKLEDDSDPYCDCADCYQHRKAAAEIRSLREQVAKERAGIVAWLRQPGMWAYHPLADAIERHEDKTT